MPRDGLIAESRVSEYRTNAGKCFFFAEAIEQVRLVFIAVWWRVRVAQFKALICMFAPPFKRYETTHVNRYWVR